MERDVTMVIRLGFVLPDISPRFESPDVVLTSRLFEAIRNTVRGMGGIDTAISLDYMQSEYEDLGELPVNAEEDEEDGE